MYKYQSYYYLNERQYYHRQGKTSKRKQIRDKQKTNGLIHLREKIPINFVHHLANANHL